MSAGPAGPRPARSTHGAHRVRPAAVCRALLLASGIALSGGAWAQQGPAASGPNTSPAAPRTASPPFEVRATLRPGVAELGQRVLYRGWVARPGAPGTARWLPPDTSANLTWGAPIVSRREWFRHRKVDAAERQSLRRDDTLFIEIPLQVFALGRVSVPGLPVELDDGQGPHIHRLPALTLEVMPVLTAADSNADYRALHGPLAAPWWERVPWTWVAAGLAALALAILLGFWWRRRRPAQAPAAVPTASPLDPAAAALAALAALRSRHLPEHGHFAEHAFGLGQILRRYLEAATGATRPGDTTPELVAHLRGAGLEAEEQTRLSGLLRVWDRVKFAREPFSLEEAVRAERSVEAFLRRPAVPARRVA
jgi:hypothetical protein